MKNLFFYCVFLSAVGCVKSYEDYYTRSFVLSWEYEGEYPLL